jgi:soluble lytic murein transglycosylase-like protein
MGQVEQIYNMKLNEVRSLLSNAASRAGFSSVSFDQVLDTAVENTQTDAAKSIYTDTGTAAYEATAKVLTASSGKSKETKYDSIIAKAAEKYDLDPALIKAVIRVESSFNANAESGCGAMGLMQLMPGTAKDLKVTDAFDPEQNVMGGAHYIRKQLNRFGDIRLALAAYNTGPARMASLHISDPDNATEYAKISKGVRGYVDKVLDYYAEYSA